MRYYGKYDRLGITSCFLIGITIAYLFEPVHRHQSYLAFVLPKAVELFFNVLETRGKVKQTNLRALLALMTISGLYGFTKSREQVRNLKDMNKHSIEKTNKKETQN